MIWALCCTVRLKASGRVFEQERHPTRRARYGNLICGHRSGLQSSQSWLTMECTAALLEGQGRVLAFDRDPKRLARLKDNVKAAAASNVEVKLADFLSLPLAADPRFRYRHQER